MQKALTVACLLGIAACSVERAAPVQPTPVAEADDAQDGEARADTGPLMRTLAGALHEEAASRPAGGIRSEDVFAALADAGVVVESPRQYLGRTAHAGYCAGGTTTDGLAVAVCEYASAAEAVAGKRYVERRFAALDDVREIHVRGATTLTLTTAPERPLGATARVAARVFSNL
jgi:hypothetical protein